MMRPRRRAYVVGAHVRAGGARMAHRIARISERRFGFEPVCVTVSADKSGYEMFGDDEIAATIHAGDVAMQSTAGDLLICNPSFSDLNLGSSFRGSKLSYVQGLNTFRLLDLDLNNFVAVSSPVRDFLSLMYGIDAPVIPAFIDVPSHAGRRPWQQRDFSMIVISKDTAPIQTVWLRRTVDEIVRKNPTLSVEFVSSYQRTHTEFIGSLSRFKFCLAFSPIEGFGLMPLEAMACGVVVVGLNGVGGREYMQPRVNCMTVDMANRHDIPAAIQELIENPGTCKLLSKNAAKTALNYSVELFDKRWTAKLEELLGEPRGS